VIRLQVKRSLFSDGRNILEKNDQTPVTIADFGVQALVSLGNYPHSFKKIESFKVQICGFV
jgi:hypothetical protein